MTIWITISAIVLGLSVLAAIVIIILYCNDVIYDAEGFGIITGFFGVFALISLIVACAKLPEYKEEYKTKVADILSISREGETEGYFTLGCGQIKEEQYYFYYYPTEKGIKLGKVKADDSYIIETPEYTPSIYKVKEYATFNDNIYYNIYVPEGTIVTAYVLN